MTSGINLWPLSSEEKAVIERLLRQIEDIDNNREDLKLPQETPKRLLRGIRDVGNWTVPAEPGYEASDYQHRRELAAAKEKVMNEALGALSRIALAAGVKHPGPSILDTKDLIIARINALREEKEQ